MYIIRFFLWLFSLIADITNEFIEKNVPLLSAAISFYAFFSIFPLLLAIIMVFSIFLGLPDFEKTILDSLKNLIPIFDEQDDEFLKGFFDSHKEAIHNKFLILLIEANVCQRFQSCVYHIVRIRTVTWWL